MNKTLIIKRKDNQQVKVELKKLNISYLDKIMELQKIIISNLRLEVLRC